MTQPTRRKGSIRMADIPPDVLRALNEGREETITLVEWLAIDAGALLRFIAPDAGLGTLSGEVERTVKRLEGKSITERLRLVGEDLHAMASSLPNREEVFEALAGHTSDMVRAWAAFMLTADATIPLSARLDRSRRFAADRSGATREIAWDSFRSYLATDLTMGLKLLEPWVSDPDPNIRRCAVEATRPRGVWAAHIEALKSDPSLALGILEPVKADPSRYVQKAAANWLNDASKTQPDWVLALCNRWTQESQTKETAWIVNQALRTLRKKGKA